MVDVIIFSFKVKNIIYRNNDTRYTIIRGVIKSQDNNSKSKIVLREEMDIRGYFPVIYKGDEFKGKGNYLLDKNNGYYLDLIDIPALIVPENKKSLSQFISKRVNRLSPKKALEIVNTLGVQALSIIKRDYTVLMKIEGIKQKKAESIRDQLTKHDKFEELAFFIQGLSLPVSLAVRIYDRYEGDSEDIIRGNPYSICYDYNISFNEADKISKNLKFSINNQKRLVAGIMDYVNYRSTNNGDLCVYQNTILNEINNHLNIYGVFKDTRFSEKQIFEAIDELVLTKRIVCEVNKFGDTLIYLTLNNIIENKIVKNLSFILKGYTDAFCTTEEIDKFIIKYEAKTKMLLDIRQKDSVYMTLKNKISILTGMPGTGKTQTTNVIVQCIQSINPWASIRLLAPTGKASTRITELTNMSASTIHRSLKLTPFNAHKNLDEIESDFIIIDESSMIDAYIFEKLTSVISEKTRVLFVGDVEQLPSVGAGLILRDLIDSGKIPTTRLTKIFRQAEESKIVTNAHKIVQGLKTVDINGVDISNAKGNNFIFWKELNPVTIMDNIMSSIDRLIEYYDMELRDVCVLSPMRKGDLGTDEINRLIQRKYNPHSSKKSEYEIDGLHLFRVGDKIMQNKNNYDLNTFNGDCGIIEKIYVIVEAGVEQWRIDVSYANKDEIITYIEPQFEEIELAYAMTIHKSQGSEFKGVIIPIHLSQSIMLYRNLVYTGITRAKEMCILIGDTKAFDEAIDKIDNCFRVSRLKEKIEELLVA